MKQVDDCVTVSISSLLYDELEEYRLKFHYKKLSIFLKFYIKDFLEGRLFIDYQIYSLYVDYYGSTVQKSLRFNLKDDLELQELLRKMVEAEYSTVSNVLKRFIYCVHFAIVFEGNNYNFKQHLKKI